MYDLTKKYKIVLVIDWLDKYGGAERVIKTINSALTIDAYYSLVCVMEKSDLRKTFGKDVKINTTLLTIFGHKFRLFLPLFPLFMKTLHISDDVNLVISSSHAIAKSVNTPKKAIHISYFQARNMKYIWDEVPLYFSGWKKIFLPIIPLLRRYDIKSAKSVDFIISNSKYVQHWVFKKYGVHSNVIYPPVHLEYFSLGKHTGDYFVTVGRLEPYKRFDLLIDAFNKNGLKLFVVGDGSMRMKLEASASSNISFTGYLTSCEINAYLGDSRAFVYAGIEDFGIAPVEAQATGAPVICLDKAGTAETVINNITGVYINSQNVDDINNAVHDFIKKEKKFNHAKIRAHAMEFSEERFTQNFLGFIRECLPKRLGENRGVRPSKVDNSSG